MSYRISKEYVWVGVIADRPGSLAEKLQALRAGGLNLEFITTRRDRAGQALLFVSPLRSMEDIETAERAGLSTENAFRIIRICGPNAPGLGARVSQALAAEGLDMCDFTAAAIGDVSVINIAFDTLEDGDRAQEVLQRLLAPVA